MASIRHVISLFLITVSGCSFCRLHPDDQRCILGHQGIDCTIDAIKAEIPRGIAIVLALIGGGTVDVPALLGALVHAGIKDGECILAALAADLTSKKSATVNETAFLKNWHDYAAAKTFKM